MIEVLPQGNRWIWQMVCEKGRVLAYSQESYPCDMSAFKAAKEYRTTFWYHASQIDARMAANI